MDEQKIPKEAWYVGAVIALCAAATAVYKYFGKRKSKPKKKTDIETDKNGEKRMTHNLHSQFFFKIGQTVYFKEDGLSLKFIRVLLDNTEFYQNLGRETANSHVIVEVEATQETGGVVQSAVFQLSTIKTDKWKKSITTDDELIDKYTIHLLGVKCPVKKGNIPESNDYIANMVVVKEKE